MRPFLGPLALVLVAGAALALASPAQAGEAQLDLAATGKASTWHGDFGGGGELRLAYRFIHIVALDVVVWEELMSVNERLNTGLTLGVTGYLPFETIRPSLRLYAIHQHEEGLVSVVDHPAGTLFGIGAGIRHRAGGGLNLGVEIPFAKTEHTEFHFFGGASATWFPDATLGPSTFFGLNAGLGLSYSLPGLP